MTWVIIILIILAVLLAAALILTAMKRKKDQVSRERAGELRSEAATNAAAKTEQKARAREVQAETDRARAQADKLEVRAGEERTTYDMTRAAEEDRLREADRLDPDVDHRSADYRPGVNGAPNHPDESTGRHTESTGPANPVPPGPETAGPGTTHSGATAAPGPEASEQ